MDDVSLYLNYKELCLMKNFKFKIIVESTIHLTTEHLQALQDIKSAGYAEFRDSYDSYDDYVKQ